MKTKMKFLSVVLAVLTVISFASCGKDADSQPENTTDAAGITQSAEVTDTAEPEATEKITEKSTVSEGVYNVTATHAFFAPDDLGALDLTNSVSPFDKCTVYENFETVPSIIKTIEKMVQLKCKVEDGKLCEWSIIDTKTGEDLGQPTAEELEEKYIPAKTGESFTFGETPETYNLSQFEENCIYTFTGPEYYCEKGCIKITNDLDENKYYAVFAQAETEFNKEYTLTPIVAYQSRNENLFDVRLSSKSTTIKLFYIEVTLEEMINLIGDRDIYHVSKKEYNYEQAKDYANGLLNDTDKPAIVEFRSFPDIVLQPGEFYYSSNLTSIKYIESEGEQ